MKINKDKSFLFFIPLLVVVVLAVLAGLFLIKQRDQSRASVSLDNQTIKVSFQISQKDQAKVSQLNQSLGLDPRWVQGLSLVLDASSSAYLNKELPMSLNLYFLADGIYFASDKPLLNLNTSLPATEQKYATGSALVDLKRLNSQDFTFKVVDPGEMVREATKSSQVYLSTQLLPLWPILEKVATIDLSVVGGSVKGDIKLK